MVRSTDVAAGGILSRDPAVAYDAVYNQYGRDPVMDGEDQGGVAEITLPADLWDELVTTARRTAHNITVNSQEAAQAINRCSHRIIAPHSACDFRL